MTDEALWREDTMLKLNSTYTDAETFVSEADGAGGFAAMYLFTSCL